VTASQWLERGCVAKTSRSGFEGLTGCGWCFAHNRAPSLNIRVLWQK